MVYQARNHGMAILRNSRICNKLQAGMCLSFDRPDLFASNDGAPLWGTIFNAVDVSGSPCSGDGQRLQLHPDQAPFLQSVPALKLPYAVSCWCFRVKICARQQYPFDLIEME